MVRSKLMKKIRVFSGLTNNASQIEINSNIEIERWHRNNPYFEIDSSTCSIATGSIPGYLVWMITVVYYDSPQFKKSK